MIPMEWHFCAICMGQGRYLEPAFGAYRWEMCNTCIGTGQVVDTDTMPLAA
jgi:DnaJ-class molecular chaperone